MTIQPHRPAAIDIDSNRLVAAMLVCAPCRLETTVHDWDHGMQRWFRRPAW